MRWAALLLSTSACGSGAVTAAAFPAAFAAAVCGVQAKCRGEAVFLERQCEDSAASLYSPDLGKAIAAGKSKFDPAQAQRCLDGLRARGCERTPPEIDQACERAVTGTVAAGSSCNWLFECATGRCDPAGPGVCPAKCAAVSSEGGACAAAPCDLRAGLRCIDNVCSRLHGADQRCTSTSDCALPLYCTSLGKCAPRGSALAVCDANEQCAPGFFCDSSNNGGLCRERGATGAPCSASSAEAIRFACADGELCLGFGFSLSGPTPGVCRPQGELGARCVASALVTGCAAGLLCANGICQDKPVSGPCALAGRCKDGVAWCNGAQCQLLESAGASCASAAECATQFCDPDSRTCAESGGSCHEP